MSQPAAAVKSGHPAGLWVLFTTEMWERFAFYAMRAILVLYLIAEANKQGNPGFGWTGEEGEKAAYHLYGLYTSLVYISPIFGGWLADMFLGQRRSVIIGAVLMALGEFVLFTTEIVRTGGGVPITWATDPTALLTFYCGLGLIILGNGFFKPCISVMVGQLYEPGDRRRDSAFTIFYMGINIGATVSPLVAGTLADKFGFHWGFFAAGIGMLVGLAIQLTFSPFFLKGIGTLAHQRKDGELTAAEKEKQEKMVYEQNRPLVKQDWDRMFVILTLSVFVIAFWLTFEQAGSSLNVFAEKNTDRLVPEVIASKTVFDVKVKDDNGKITSVKKENLFKEAKAEKIEAAISAETEEVKAALELEIAAASLTAIKDFAEKEKFPQEVSSQENKEKINLEKATANLEKTKQAAIAAKQEAENPRYENRYVFPAAWYQSVNPLGIVIFAPIFTLMWNFLHRRGIEPSTPTKFALGILLVSVSFFVMIPGAIQAAHTGGNAAAYWLLACYLFATWGELCLSPVGLSMITKLAPARYSSVFMGVWFLASASAYWLAGYCAALFAAGEGVNIFFGPENGLADFFLLLAIIPAAVGLFALVLVPVLKKKMHGIN
ncbi:MAG: peptide MFS transporter [Planctomycetaceae bacterium]|jgi:POT family proton-dependent oligopeptide transporter|nr:peptide MFS transporter [Planctomycetaceae bacterium]